MPADKRIRVLIADDSVFMCRVLQSIISTDPELEVLGLARNGREAIAKSEALRPDVITMDIDMPYVDGLQATEVIMSSDPRPIIVVSPTSREDAAATLRALEMGAIDFVAKSSTGVDLDMSSVRDELRRKLKLAARVRVVRNATRPALAQKPAEAPAQTAAADTARSGVAVSRPARSSAPVPSPASAGPNGRLPIVCVAASTGGPATLMRLVPTFPADFPGAVLLIQHMPAGFTAQFVEQLAAVAAVRVKEAEPGEPIFSGTIYVCPGSHHLRVSPAGRILLEDRPRVAGHCPCADLAMETLASFAGPMSAAVVLTGMGCDGARGVIAIKAAGGHVIAQDKSSSVIFGMPSEAIRTGVVDEVLPLAQIYAAIDKHVLFSLGAARVDAI